MRFILYKDRTSLHLINRACPNAKNGEFAAEMPSSIIYVVREMRQVEERIISVRAKYVNYGQESKFPSPLAPDVTCPFHDASLPVAIV